jgi:hypothetical protein
MSHAFKTNEDVHHQPKGPQGRVATAPSMVYTIVQACLLKLTDVFDTRIKSKSENIERVVTEDQLSYAH